jgi:WD40 repeat protein
MSGRPFLLAAPFLHLVLGPAHGEEPASRTDPSGDPLPAVAVARIGTTRFRHGEAVKAIGFSQDGKQVISADGHGGPSFGRFWDRATGRQMRQIPIVRTLYQVRLSPDLSLIAWVAKSDVRPPADDDQPIPPESVSLVDVYDLKTGARLRRLQLPGHEVQDFAFSPDGKRIATRHQGGRIIVWDCRSGDKLAKLEAPGEGFGGFHGRVAFIPGGKLLAAGYPGNTQIHFWDLAADRPVEKPLDVGHFCYGMQFSPDGRLVAVSGPEQLSVLELATGKTVRRFRLGVATCAFSPDGKVLASTGTDKEAIRLWDVGTGKERWSVPGSGHNIAALAFAPDGKTLAAGGYDCVLRFWDVATGKEVQAQQGARSRLSCLAFRGAGRTLATGDDAGNVRLWQSVDGRPVRDLLHGPADPGALRFSSDGSLLMRADPLSVLDAATGKELWRPGEKGQWVTGLTFPPDGRLLTWGLPEKKVLHLCAAATGKEIRRLEVAAYTTAFSPDGRTLATGSKDGVRLWEVATGRLLGHHGELHLFAFVFTPDGRVLVGLREQSLSGAPYTLAGAEVATGKERWSIDGFAGFSLPPTSPCLPTAWPWRSSTTTPA